MGTITINDRKYQFTDEKNVLTIIRKAGIDIPTLCYIPELSTFGACRLCTVEDDRGKTFASCSEVPRDGMVIYTNTERLRRHRKLIVELMLAAHDCNCLTCRKNGNCKLQTLAMRLGVSRVRFTDYREPQPIDDSSYAIVRDPNKCILCGDCVRACGETQGIGVLNFMHRGSNAVVSPAQNRPLTETNCVSCGQCRVVCPTGALTIKDSTQRVWQAIQDPNVRVVAQIAPAVRVAVGEAFHFPEGTNVLGKIVSAMLAMGFDEVFDTTYSADLTIMEEAAEFLYRVKNGGTLPLLTSCCPAWVKFVENEFPDFGANLSTCRSPQGMFSAVLKEHYRRNDGGKKTFVVSIMPCTAKKMESERADSYTSGEKDTDAVVTSTELVAMIRHFGLDFAQLPEEACDMPFGLGSGGGVIFGVTGGVTEAVLRRLSEDAGSGELDAIAHCGIRGNEGIKEATIPYGGMEVKICVASGLANARRVMEQVRSGEKTYHLIEIMACPGGCVMGGGQPTQVTYRKPTKRGQGLYKIDQSSPIKKPHDNPLMEFFYQGPYKDMTHELLHVPHGTHLNTRN